MDIETLSPFFNPHSSSTSGSLSFHYVSCYLADMKLHNFPGPFSRAAMLSGRLQTAIGAKSHLLRG
jgi:hypothetical protein